jgi:hypothetical protein
VSKRFPTSRRLQISVARQGERRMNARWVILPLYCQLLICLLLVDVAEGHLRLPSTFLLMGWWFRRNVVPKPGSYHQLPGLETKSPLCPSYASLGLNAASTIRPSIKGL